MVDDAVGIDTDVNGEAIRACEVAQAALFAAALKTEITGLRVRVEAAEQRWERRQFRASGIEREVPERLRRLRAQLDEAILLLDRCALVARRRPLGWSCAGGIPAGSPQSGGQHRRDV